MYIGLSSIVLLLLLKYSLDSYREDRYSKKTIIAIISSFLVGLFLFSMVVWISMTVWIGWIVFLPFLILPIGVFIIYYLAESLDEYKKDEDLKKIGRNLAIIAVVLIIMGASIYSSIEYIRTPDAKQKFVLTLEQNQTDEIELIIPNLKGDGRYFPVEDYNSIKGEGEVQSHEEGEYIKITTSSETFKIKYSKEAEMFSEYNDEWDFQYDKIEYEEIEEVGQEMMNISFSSNQNTTCNLKLRWWDEYNPKIGFGGHREVEADAYIDDETESIEVLDRAAAE
ncbi:MAG: hypothetical protein V5A88_05585 [Candidatus Thermoplasmatota archaeon]